MAVRNESVRLELDDQFTSGMARAAAAAALLNTQLDNINRNNLGAARSTNLVVNNINQVSQSATRASSSINTFSGRLGLLLSAAGALGPALVPIGAVAVPAITGLAGALGAAALAGGTTVIAFQGVGDALTAVNDAALEPTAANLLEAESALSRLSPAARDLVGQLQDLRPAMTGIRDVAAAGLFPGLSEALDDIETRTPEVERIIARVAETTGGLFADAGASLASAEFDEFFDFLATDVPQSLAVLGAAVGNVTRGLADLFIAFDPLNDDLNGAILRASEGFATWADNLSQTDGFAEFVDYVRQSGPQVAEAVGAIANAMIQIVQAAAPLGGPVLAGIEAFADAVAAIADSDFGTPIAVAVGAMSALNLATAALNSTLVTTVRNANLARGALVGIAQGAVLFGLGQLDAALDELANTDFDGSTLDRSLEALSKGRVEGTIFETLGEDLEQFSTDLGLLDDSKLSRLNRFLDIGPGDSVFEEAAQRVGELDAKLAQLVESGHEEAAARIFDQFVKAAERGGRSVEEVEEKFEQYGIAVENASDPRVFSGFLAAIRPGIREAAEQMREAADATEDFTSALAELNGFLDRRAAFRGYQAALDDFTKSVKDNGRSFDENTEKGRANKQALDDIAGSAAQVAEQMRGSNRARFLRRAAVDIRQIAEDLNLPREATQRVIDKLLEAGNVSVRPKIGADIREALQKMGLTNDEINKLDRAQAEALVKADNRPALGALAGVNAALTNFDNRTATANLAAQDNASGTIANVLSNLRSLDGTTAITYINTVKRPQADGGFHESTPHGGLVQTFAHGGFAGRIGDQQPQLRPYTGPAGLTWSEEGSGPWEAFISGHPAKRLRSRSIAEQVAERLGGQVMWRAADGLLLESRLRSASPTVNVSPSLTATTSLSDRDVQRIADAVERGSARGTGERLASSDRRVRAGARV